jgi:superfamily II DNA or RNA helicase
MLEDHDGSVRAIINYDKIRSKKGFEKNAEEKNELLRYLEEKNKKFNFILCDEAHKMRNDDTQTYKGAKKLLESADSVVFLTATPIMISERNLFNLLYLLDSQRYSNYSIFEQGLRENAPFIRALRELTTKKELPVIAEDLMASEITIRQEINERIFTETYIVAEHFKEFPLFKRIIERMMNEDDSLTLRSQLQYDIMSMSQMNKVFSRTRKREVTTDWTQAERHPYPCIVPLYKDEQEEFDAVIENYIDDNSYTDWNGEQRLTQGGALGLVQKKRQIASSVYAYLNDYDQLVAGHDAYELMPDAKFDELLRVIKEVFKNGQNKLIVFGLFKKTLYYLSIRLKKARYNSVIIHGDIMDRQEVLDEFRLNPNIQVLLSSEVGSEGLDMQFCNTMVNYDLPWNPMVVEQRIGRIDRFGQESPIVHIYNMIVEGSIQEDIYTRLLERIGIFHESIGEMEAILDPEIEGDASKRGQSLQQMYSGMEKEFFCKNLSREERQKKIDEIAQAYINERENLKKIEEGLTNTLTNDAYFRNEINRILNNNAYVTESELKSYIDMLIKEHLTTCRLSDQGDGIYKFEMPKSNIRVLHDFLFKYMPSGDETYSNFKQFTNSIEGDQSFELTFDQEVAYKKRNIVFVNLYNPIIQAALQFFEQQTDNPDKTFRFDVRQSNLSVNIPTGKYFLAVYQVEISKIIFGTKKITNILHPILYDVQECKVIEDCLRRPKFSQLHRTKSVTHEFANLISRQS